MSIALPAPARSENVRGIIAMLAAMAVFVFNDTLVKIAAASLPTGEAIFVRGLFVTMFCGVLIVRTGVLWALPHALSPRVLYRALADVGGTVFFLIALVRMPIGDVFGILQFTPLAITAAAALFLGAKVGWRRWSATCVGLIGVLLIVRPGGSAFTPYALLVFISMLFAVGRDLLTRSVAANVPALVIVGTSAAVVTVASLGFNAFEAWTWPSPTSVLILLAASFALLAGQYWLVAAMRLGEIAVVAPFRYSIILWAILAGFVVWRESPDLYACIGIAIVSGAGLYTFLREQQLARARARP
jgi:drug/metabolite transporter (DMT)-like permease